VSISNKPTENMSCNAGVCTATAQKAVLNAGDLQAMLASGDVAVKTGSVAKDIEIDQPLTWASTSRLTLDAQRSITIRKPVTVNGQGAITLAFNQGESAGDLYFFDKGDVTFFDLASTLVINGTGYVLVGNLTTLGSDVAKNPAGSYALAASYDAKGEVFHKAPVATTFSGNFEGLGHTILHVKVKHGVQGCAGTFARTEAALIRDITLKKVSVFSKAASAVGGLVGCNAGDVVNVGVEGTVKADSEFVDVGGLAGDHAGLIERSRSSVSLSSMGKQTGGLVGVNSGIIDKSFVTGPVAGNIGNVGGLAALNEGYISNSYASAAVTANNAHIGGLLGTTGVLSVDQVYSTGQVETEGNLAGGLVGVDDGSTFKNSYWDLDTTGITDPSQGAGQPPNDPGITGLTDAQPKAGLPAGFDPKIWGSSARVNDGYPYLLANPPT